MASSLSSLTSNPQDTPDYYGAYTGMWINWSRGKVLGSTITLSRRDGSLLIAFTAFFITIVSTSFWRIACFVFHTRFSTANARDGVHHQRQAVLRNSANGASGLVSLLLVLWSWRSGKNEAKHAYSRLLPLIIFTTATLVLFAIASGFSSTISSGMGNEVLISSDRCGIVWATGTNDTFFNIGNSYQAQSASTAFIYAQQCYSNTSNPGKCGTYIKPRLPVTVERNASCPFADEMCYTQHGSIRLDSGLIDSLDDVGLNTGPDRRFQFRQTLECAPLNTTKFQVTHNYSDSGSQELYRQYRLGYSNNSDVVYEHREMLESQIDRTPQSYELSASVAYSMNNSYDIPWTNIYPIDELRAPYADVSLYYLSANAVQFRNETDDLWFSAHRAGPRSKEWSSGFVLDKVFLQDDPASVLGCAARQQLCNPNMPDGSNKCTPLSSTIDTIEAYPSIVRGEAEQKAMNWFRQVVNPAMSDVYSLVEVLGVSALKAREKMRWGLQGALPDNQWQVEVESWFNMAMAGTQLSFHETATGPSDPDIPLLSDTFDKYKGFLCHNQKMRSTAYINISTLGLGLIFGLGGFIIILSYTIEPITACVQSRRRGDHYSRLEWIANDVLQLQRLAHEELGLGGAWRNCAGAVPTTARPGDPLGVLDVSDPEHPRLKVPTEVFEEDEKKNGGTRANEGREVSVSPTLTGGGDWEEQRRGSI